MSHVITVTRAYDDPAADTEDPEYVIGGEHDRWCAVWYRCEVEGCDADDEGVFHGVEHIVVAGVEGYCTRSDECGLTYAFQYDNPEWQMTKPGVYDVGVDWDGDDWLALLTLRPEPQGSGS